MRLVTPLLSFAFKAGQWYSNSSSHSEDALDVTATHRQHYINSIVKNWETFDPKEVRSEGIKDCQIIFNNS